MSKGKAESGLQSFAAIRSFLVKFQYSLRTLIIACFVAGIVLYFAVGSYLDKSLAKEMWMRDKLIEGRVNELCHSKREEGVRSQPKVVLYSTSGGASYSSSEGFNFFVRFERSGLVGRNSGDEFEQDGTLIYSMRIRCGRNAVAINPIEFDYDDAIENDTLLAALKILCDEHHWPYVTRKVDHIENDKSQMTTAK